MSGRHMKGRLDMSKFTKSVISSAAAACLMMGSVTMADTPVGNQAQPGATGIGGAGGGTAPQVPSNQGTGVQDANQAGGPKDGAEAHRMAMQQVQKADNPDKLFLLHVAMGNQAELQWAQVAQTKSQNPQVKQVADAITKDHTKLGESLQKLLDQQGLEAPKMAPPIAQQELKVAQSLPNDQFDQCFLSAMKAGHMATISKFEDEAKVAKDAGVRQFASENLPTLQQHAQMIQQTAVAVGLPSGSDAQPASSKITPDSSKSNSTGTDRK